MTYDEHIDCDNQLCEAEDRIIAFEVDNKRLEKIINYAGGSPPPAANLRFTDMLLPLEAENKQLLERANRAEATLVKFEQLATEEIQGFNALQADNKRLKEARDEYHDQYHLCEAKLLSHKSLLKQGEEAYKQLKEALEHAKVHFAIIYEHHTRPRQSRGNTSKRCKRAVEEIDQALKDVKDE